MGKRAEEPEKENNERWTLTYLDMITLLFAFFVVLYAMSNVDSKKYEQLSEGLENAFDGGNMGILEQKQGGGGIQEGIEKPEIVATPKKGEARQRVVESVKSKISGKNIEISENTDGIVITMFADLNFDPGSTEMTEAGYSALRSLAPTLKDMKNEIRIVGHTDTTPVADSASYINNWELASRRALGVLNALVLYGVDEKKLCTVSYGSTRPLQTNATSEGRAYNRRVEIVLSFAESE